MKKGKQFKRLWSLMLLLIAMLAPRVAWAEITPSQPAAGTGTPSDPYQITNREELYWFVAETNNDKTVCAKLIADIVVNEGTFDSDGKWSKPGTPESWKPMAVYGGIFDGNGHVISGLYNNDGDAVLNVGFCSGLSNGTIKNLGIINTYFNAGKFYSGIIAPNVTSGIITNCYTAASTIIGTQYAGGIIAANIGYTISNCYSTSTGNSSKGQNYYGGISGINRSGEIVNCYTNQPINRGGGVHKDDSDFKSGEVTYLLNEGKNDGTQVWFQDLSEGGDDYPTFVNTGSNAVQLSSDGKSYVNNIAHTHTLTKVDAVAATSTEHGHNEYWACSGCGNWFADETGTTLTTIEELVTHYIEYVNGMGTCQVCNSFRYEVPPTDMQGTYLIGNTGQLIAFANMVNNGQDFRAANAKLISDIILNEGSFGTDGTFIATGSSEPSTPFSWPIIGAGTHTGNGYKGTFDGQGHTVSGLYVYANQTGLASFVGILEANGKIMNLGVINSYFEGSRVGGICGYTDGKSEIIDCYSDIIGKGDYIGGIVGQGSECKGISNCYSTSELTCTVDFLSAGGIVGEKNSTFPITNCYTTCSTILGLTFNSFESACEAGVSVERFASGEIAYKLNGSTSESNFVWYQKIGEGGDAYPSLTKAEDNTVYYVPGYFCDGVTADGEMHYSNNGGRYVADHTEATDAAVAATCTETGLTEGKHCSVCDGVLVAQTVTDALAHSYELNTLADVPDAQTENLYSYLCDNCGHEHDSKKVIKNLQIDLDVVIEKDAQGRWTTDQALTIADKRDFNAPVAFTARSVTFKRSFIYDGGMYSFCLPFDIEASNIQGGAFYEYSSIDNDDWTVSFSKVTGTIEANKGYFFYPTVDIEEITVENARIAAKPETTSPSEARIYGTLCEIDLPQGAYSYLTDWWMGGSYFARAETGNVMAPFRAYLWLGEAVNAAKLCAIFDGIEEDITGIDGVKFNTRSNDTPLYNLRGQRISAPKQGEIYIQNGKKVIKK